MTTMTYMYPPRYIETEANLAHMYNDVHYISILYVQEQREALSLGSYIDDDSYVYEALEKVVTEHE